MIKEERSDDELPWATHKWGWKFHHVGIPTSEIKPNEKYLPHLKFYTSGFEQSPFGIEWIRFEDDCPLHERVKTVPHVAFQVDDLDKELKRNNFKILTQPNAPSGGVRVAMIEHNGAPVELIEFSKCAE
ncbi:VOC family protein [Mariniphaga sp.]|uniref:VOC family protein n=1 Tax=Mariniphaga sp. TaxID=1954475 RepID=UPI0035690C25